MNNCIFCKIIAGQIPAHKLYENDLVLAFLDINPINPGHTLVVPKKHSTNILDIEPRDWAAVAEVARKMAKVLHDALGADGINLGMNNREHAGQVVDHPHVHVMPRHKGDGFALWHGHPYKKGEAEIVAAKIKGAL
jgi:histidine triad (HIT) family protein